MAVAVVLSLTLFSLWNLNRQKTASALAVAIGREKSKEFSERLHALFIRRTKEEVLLRTLPAKDERIVFCHPTDIQKRLYKHILQQADFILLKKASGPCDCGINQVFFEEYWQQPEDERVEFQRRNKATIKMRGQCCYKVPHSKFSPDGFDPNALLWRNQHRKLENCDSCPFCICLPALNVLYKVCSHAALLQVKDKPEHFLEGTERRSQAEHHLNLAKLLIPPDVLGYLPGGSYFRADSIMNDHCALSGKMKTLQTLLQKIDAQQGRILLFSASTQMLDLIEDFLRSAGYRFLRMDGSTSKPRREELVQEFKRDNGIFLFLLSTKAMGLGLNLTEANFVIIFDVEWYVAVFDLKICPPGLLLISFVRAARLSIIHTTDRNPSWDAQAQVRRESEYIFS